MAFTLSEEHRLVRDTVRRFVDAELIPLEGKATVDGKLDPAIEARLMARCKELGLWQVDVPEEFGGQGLGLTERCLIWAELGRQVALPTRGLTILGPDVRPILYALEGEMRDKYLYPSMRGELTSCFAQSEPEAGSDPGSMRTTAVREGDEYVINGTKLWITGADTSDFMLLMAATDRAKGSRGGISAFVVDMDTPGVRLVTAHRTFTDEYPWEITLDNVRIPAGHLIGGEGEGFKLGQQWLGGGRIKQGARALGVMERMIEMSARYANQRVTFGKPLAERQAIQWMLADAHVALQAARLLVFQTAAKFDAGEPIRHDAPVVKLFCTEAAYKATDMAMQIHGGMGLTREMPIERFWRDQRSHLITEGTPEMMRMAIARHVLKEMG